MAPYKLSYRYYVASFSSSYNNNNNNNYYYYYYYYYYISILPDCVKGLDGQSLTARAYRKARVSDVEFY